MWRITCFATNTKGWSVPDLEVRHRQRARAEDRIRNLKDSGLTNLPFSRIRPESDLARDHHAGRRPAGLELGPGVSREAGTTLGTQTVTPATTQRGRSDHQIRAAPLPPSAPRVAVQ